MVTGVRGKAGGCGCPVVVAGWPAAEVRQRGRATGRVGKDIQWAVVGGRDAKEEEKEKGAGGYTAGGRTGLAREERREVAGDTAGRRRWEEDDGTSMKRLEEEEVMGLYWAFRDCLLTIIEAMYNRAQLAPLCDC
jgi:hypothetical protein